MGDKQGASGVQTKLISIGGVVALSVISGIMVVSLQIYPYSTIEPLLQQALFALSKPDSATRKREVPESNLGQLTEAVRSSDLDAVATGYNFFCIPKHGRGYLISRDGRTQHTWHLDSKALESTEPNWRGCRMSSNGSVFAWYRQKGWFPDNYGLVKLDEASKPVWEYSGPVVRDVEVTDEGELWGISERMIRTPASLRNWVVTLGPYIYEESVVHIAPDGKQIERISLRRALMESPYREIMADWREGGPNWRLLGINDVEIVPPEFAERFDRISANSLMLSVRAVSAIVFIDPGKRQVVWALKGNWVKQTDVDFLERGQISLFDSFGEIGPGGMGAVKTIELDNYLTRTRLGEELAFDMTTPRGGAQQILPNNNVMVTDVLQGVIREFTPEGKEVWRFEAREFESKALKPDAVRRLAPGGQHWGGNELSFEVSGGNSNE